MQGFTDMSQYLKVTRISAYDAHDRRVQEKRRSEVCIEWALDKTTLLLFPGTTLTFTNAAKPTSVLTHHSEYRYRIAVDTISLEGADPQGCLYTKPS